MCKTSEFISKAKKIHGEQYNYSKVKYIRSTDTVIIECPIHGEFYQTPNSHLNGYGCKPCGIAKSSKSNYLTTEEFIEKAKIKHGERYDYSSTEYVNSKTKVEIVCNVHGKFYQQPNSHLSGYGCKLCGDLQKGTAKRYQTSEFIRKAIKVHGDKYSYEETHFSGNRETVKISCPNHGVFFQAARTHLIGSGCPDCAKDKKSKNRRLLPEEFKERAIEVHGGVYGYESVNVDNYINNRIKIPIICSVHGEYRQTPMTHLNGSGCKQCTKNGASTGEIEILEFVKELGLKAVLSDRKTIYPKEIDILIPDKNVGIEFNGVFWHSDKYKPRMYHVDKKKSCEEKGIDLIQVFEDEWANSKDIVKSIIASRVGAAQRKIYARKTVVEVVTPSIARDFYQANHIQGFCGAEFHYALTHNGEIISMASFGKPRKILVKDADYDLELIRFCSALNTQVVGGFSKLIANVKDKRIITYCDNRLFNAKGYKAVGFKSIRTTPPSYFYSKNASRKSRFECQKHKLSSFLRDFDPEKSESENMTANGYHKVYDCGTTVLEMRISKYDTGITE